MAQIKSPSLLEESFSILRDKGVLGNGTYTAFSWGSGIPLFQRFRDSAILIAKKKLLVAFLKYS